MRRPRDDDVHCSIDRASQRAGACGTLGSRRLHLIDPVQGAPHEPNLQNESESNVIGAAEVVAVTAG
jgi:hypothetical protein